MTAVRLPASAVISAGLHAGCFAAYFLLMPAKKEGMRVISNVDLLVQVRRPAAAVSAPAPKQEVPPSTWNFLKMALPTIPKIPAAAPQALDVKLPEIKRPSLSDPEKIVDRGRLEKKQSLDALDLGKRRVDAADVKPDLATTRRAAASLAAMPQLEEVGRRRVTNLPQALALEEARREAVALQRVDPGALAAGPAGRMAPRQAMAVLREASPPERARLGDKMPSLLPASGGLEPAASRPAVLAAPKPALAPAASARRREAAALDGGPKKGGVEIEGPLRDRKIVSYEIPAFPAWAREQGIMEAAVAIRFFVGRDGTVLPGMRVELTSGSGRLDRLAMDALKNWRFVELGADERQWGVITFRFVLE